MTLGQTDVIISMDLMLESLQLDMGSEALSTFKVRSAMNFMGGSQGALRIHQLGQVRQRQVSKCYVRYPQYLLKFCYKILSWCRVFFTYLRIRPLEITIHILHSH